MKYISLQPFVPSGKDFEKAKLLFIDLGFSLEWEDTDYAGFTNNSHRFILQRFDNPEFASQFMISVGIENADEFYRLLMDRKLSERYGVKIAEPFEQSYGKEVNLIDMAGVCWHFVQ